MKAIVPDYGKVIYDDKAIQNIFSLANFSRDTESPMTYTKMMLSMFTPIEG